MSAWTNQNHARVALHMTPTATCLLTDLRRLDDGEVVHAGHARSHGGPQTRRAKLHPGGEACPQSLDRSFSEQVPHHRCRLGIL